MHYVGAQNLLGMTHLPPHKTFALQLVLCQQPLIILNWTYYKIELIVEKIIFPTESLKCIQWFMRYFANRQKMLSTTINARILVTLGVCTQFKTAITSKCAQQTHDHTQVSFTDVDLTLVQQQLSVILNTYLDNNKSPPAASRYSFYKQYYYSHKIIPVKSNNLKGIISNHRNIYIFN